MSATLFTHLRVRADLLDLRQVQRDLYVPNLKYSEKIERGYELNEKDYEGIELWDEDGDYLILPRGYSPPWKGEPGEIEDLRPEWPFVPGLVFLEKLRHNQVAPAISMEQLGDKLLCLGCGKGKTVLALWYAAARSVKTLVIVDLDMIANQWDRQITRYLGIPKEEIGRIQAKTFEVGDRITVAMIKTLQNRLDVLDADFYDQFGLVIVDEAHILGAPTAYDVLPNFPGERLLLSATPERRDGMHPVFMLHGGGLQPCFVDVSRDQSSRWTFVDLPQVLDREPKNLFRMHMPTRRMRFSRPVYETAAGESEEFNLQILREVFAAEQAGRNIIVLGSRVEQLRHLCDVALSRGLDASLVVGEVKGTARDEALEHKLIFATWKIAGKALDVERLDTLMLLYPTDDEGFLRQAVGRIDRMLEGKKESVCIIFNHTAYDSLVRKADRMRDVIQEIDPGARITCIKRNRLLPPVNPSPSSAGATSRGTPRSPGRTPRGRSVRSKAGAS